MEMLNGIFYCQLLSKLLINYLINYKCSDTPWEDQIIKMFKFLKRFQFSPRCRGNERHSAESA